MIIKSLRWRLIAAMSLVIAAVVAAAGVFSSVTAKRQLDLLLIEENDSRHGEAAAWLRAESARGPAALPRALAEIHARHQLQTVVFDAAGRLVAAYPRELASWNISRQPPDVIRLRRNVGGMAKAIELHVRPVEIPGLGSAYFLPDHDRGREPRLRRIFVSSFDRWLAAGLAVAGLLALAVMATVFRRVLAPVEALTSGAHALAGGRLDTRVAVRGGDEIGELAAAFNSMADALERNEQARRNLVTDVAHELRTPLTNIRAQIEAVQDGLLEPGADLLKSLHEEAAVLARLVDDLQQLSLGDAGALRLQKSDLALDGLVERALAGLERQIEEQGLTLERRIEAHAAVFGDPQRLVQVVRNLVVNAAKHARTRISITAEKAGERIEIRVEDDGPGVPLEHAERIFDRFHRADPSRSRSTGGAGLGLAIARQIAELHGGTLRLENRPGEGATFIVSLP